MGFWTKRETTHYARDKYGNIVSVERKSDAELNAEREIERFNQRQREKQERQEQRAKEKDAYRTEYKMERIERMKREGKKAGRMQPYARLSRVVLGPSRPRTQVRYKMPQPQIRMTSKKKKQKTIGLDPIDNWGFL